MIAPVTSPLILAIGSTTVIRYKIIVIIILLNIQHLMHEILN